MRLALLCVLALAASFAAGCVGRDSEMTKNGQTTSASWRKGLGMEAVDRYQERKSKASERASASPFSTTRIGGGAKMTVRSKQ